MIKFITEVSSNHSRDLERAMEFIDCASKIGCDAVKFQLFKIDMLFSSEILENSKKHRDRKKWELPIEFLPILAKRCKEKNIQFSCTPFYLDAVKELEPYVDFYKIAGISQIKDFKKINLRDIKKIFEINFFSNFYFTQKLITNMMQNKFGRIIFISSIGGQWGGVNQVHYAASKAALINLSRSLSKLYSKFGVLSNSIAVGLVKTKMSKKEILKNKKIKLNIPMQRFGEKEEIADAVSFLCSKKSSYITGQTINLNGGMLS